MNNKIEIFQAEKDAGLESLISANASIAYQAPVLLSDQPAEIQKNWKPLPFAKAAKEEADIYHVYSILVTTSWNKNDDVFSKEEVWASKDTPKYKPTNLEHDEKQIVGGMIDNWAVDKNFNLIEGNIDPKDLPDHYHILVSSVIYKQWQDKAYQKRAMDLISQIEAGQKHVSLECIFRGFDYAVVAPDGKNHILARNDETAFLTQHLRSYGGTGSYQDHQVGRLLRSITFSGKGFVDRPANPESIIFDQNRVFEFNKASISSKNMFLNENGVIMKIDNLNRSDTQESDDMSNEILNEQIAELKTALESAKAENKELADKLSDASISKYEKTVDELTQQAQSTQEQITSLTKDLETSQSSVEELTSALETSNEAYAKLETEIAEMKAAAKLRSRKIALIHAGLSDEEAEAKLETFGDLSDEQFEALAETLLAYTKTLDAVVQSDTSQSTEPEDDGAEASEVVEEVEAVDERADEEVLETVQAEEAPQLSVEADESVGSDDKLEATRANLCNWVETVILDNNS